MKNSVEDIAAEVGTRHAIDILRKMIKMEDIYPEPLRGDVPEPYDED